MHDTKATVNASLDERAKDRKYASVWLDFKDERSKNNTESYPSRFICSQFKTPLAKEQWEAWKQYLAERILIGDI